MDRFGELSEKSNTLLESFKIMEESINLAKEKHYQHLYIYRQEIKEEVKKINMKLDSTLKESVLKDKSKSIRDDILGIVVGKKLEILLEKFLSIFDNSSILLVEDEGKYYLQKENNNIADIKIMKKKISITWLDLNMVFYLEPNKIKSNQHVLNTCKLISNI